MSATGQGILIVTLVVLNFIAAALYYIVNTVIKLNKEKSIMIKTFVIALCPVVGIVFISPVNSVLRKFYGIKLLYNISCEFRFGLKHHL